MALDVAEKSNQRLLMELAEQHGPVFKAMAWNELWICIIGLDRCSRFIQENKDRIRPVTIDVTRLYQRGFLRQMQGEEHRTYRKPLVIALRDEQFPHLRNEFLAIIETGLATFLQSQSGPESLLSALNDIASRLLIRLFYGSPDRSAFCERLLAGHRTLGPHGLVWNHGPRQEAAYRELEHMIREEYRDVPSPTGGVARRLHAMGVLDDTMLGHVIIMVEMGRYDLQGFFRWLLRYAGQNPERMDRIALEDDVEPAVGNSLARAFVLETFRLDQSERLVRQTSKDIVFDGYLIPRHAKIRLCLWESHKSSSHFSDPFTFRPDRFVDGDLPADQFSPFGLDEHYCPLAEPSIFMGTLFLRALARGYRVASVGDGTPVRGAYHWEPPVSFTVRLSPR